MDNGKIIEGTVLRRTVSSPEEKPAKEKHRTRDAIGYAAITAGVSLAAGFTLATIFYPHMMAGMEKPNIHRFNWSVMTPEQKAPFWCILNADQSDVRPDWDGKSMKCPPRVEPK